MFCPQYGDTTHTLIEYLSPYKGLFLPSYKEPLFRDPLLANLWVSPTTPPHLLQPVPFFPLWCFLCIHMEEVRWISISPLSVPDNILVHIFPFLWNYRLKDYHKITTKHDYVYFDHICISLSSLTAYSSFLSKSTNRSELHRSHCGKPARWPNGANFRLVGLLSPVHVHSLWVQQTHRAKGQSKQTPQAVAPPLLLENVGAFIQNSKPSYKMTSPQNSKIAPRKKEQEEM